MKRKTTMWLRGLAAAAVLMTAFSTAAFAAPETADAVPDLLKQSTVKNAADVAAKIDEIQKVTDTEKYAYNGWQVMKTAEDGTVQVLKAEEWGESSGVADLCREYGYSYGAAQFYYDNPDASATAYSNYGPVLIVAQIDDKEYRYYFMENQLIRRVAPEGTSDNPASNAFLNSFYKIGAMYREPGLIVSENTRDLTVTGGNDVRLTGSAFSLSGRLSPVFGDPESEVQHVTLVLDEKTELVNPAVDEGYFPMYQEGDTAFQWYRRLYLDENPMSPLGVFPVDVTGNHIDRIYGSFWWD